MDFGSRQNSVAPKGLLLIEDCLDADGRIAMPPGTTLISLIERNITNVGNATAYRYLDYARSDGDTLEVTWAQLGHHSADHRGGQRRGGEVSRQRSATATATRHPNRRRVLEGAPRVKPT
jgi:acyl-CoA synthetase (AMP-forming)/AMP-acid ligase II